MTMGRGRGSNPGDGPQVEGCPPVIAGGVLLAGSA